MALVVAVLGSAVVAGCSGEGGVPGRTGVGVAVGPGSPAAAPPEVGSTFNTTDVAWLQLADALHTRALPMLALPRGRTGNRPLAELAARLAGRHETGRGRLRSLLVRAGVSGENPHASHDMPGMPTAAELRALKEMRDDAFDRRFAELVRAYLDQLVLVADGEQRSGAAEDVRELAAEMSRGHAAELAELRRSVG